MITAVHITKFIFGILLLIVLLPFIVLWLLIIYEKYKFVLINSLVKSGMPGDMAKIIAKETRPGRMIDFGKFGIPKPDTGKVT